MNRKKVLEKRMARLNDKIAELVKRSQESDDVNEVRSIQSQIADLKDEVEDCKAEIEAINEDEARAAEAKAEAEKRDNAPLMNGDVTASFGQANNINQTRAVEDPYGTMEYRMGFKKYVQTGDKSDLAVRAAEGTVAPATTGDIGAIIPTTILNELIKKVEGVYGQLYSKVRKMNIKGGVKVPIADLQASFKWITETTKSPNQAAGKIDEFVEFSYNIGEIRVTETLLASIVSLDVFEREVTELIMRAYVEAMDKGIMLGTGNGQMLGILNDPRVTGQADHIIEMTAADFNDWTKWRKNFFSKLPLAKRGGEFIFPVSTVESYLLTMADSNNNPIFKQATGFGGENSVDGANVDRFFGRAVTLVEPDIIGDFDTASAGDVVGVYWTPTDYAINTQMQFGIKRYFDDDKNEWVNKALTIVDGKMLDVQGCYIIKKK